ncbi:YoaK family protein [uncultured Clostridium sp.]|uniref:YoaK family protein n=1 Tax=uncultured Clostridium sp. TaxID=59620 RepID=UPI0025D9600B|nr:YoaK family protein [uncultured Clostridium sp.]
MDNQNKNDFYIHSIMCLIGGFMGGYAILNRCGNLGSAQTANLIYVVTCFLGHNLKEFFIRILGVVLYFIAIELYVFIVHKTKINVQRYGILILIAGSIFLNFIPATSDPVAGLLPLFFIMATQWSIFHGANGYNSSTIFSTNNFRQASLAIGEYICTKDKGQISKAKFFGNSLLWYHVGVAFSFFACRFFNEHASLFCLIPEGISLLLTYKNSEVVSPVIKSKATTA